MEDRKQPAMDTDELRSIGERLYGRWGWQTRLAEALGVDGSTVRRWKAAGVPGAVEASAIRNLGGTSLAPSSEPETGADPAEKALALLARIEAAARKLSADNPTTVSSSFAMRKDGVEITLRISRQNGGTVRVVAGRTDGYRELEVALATIENMARLKA
jgi:hypothetical protein